MNTSPHWQQQATAHWPLINRLAARRFAQETLAEEAALFVMDKLAENDWRRLRAYTGRSTMATYVGALTLRLLEDFSRQRFGRLKAPAWVRRLGGIWATLFRLLCMERLAPDAAVAQLTARQSCATTIAEQAAYQMLGEIPSCGSHRGQQVELTELEEDRAGHGEEGPSQPEEQLEATEREQWMSVLGRILLAEEEGAIEVPHLERLLGARINLEPRDRLLLKLCFRDGLAVAEAGRMLGWNQNQAHGRLRRLLERLRQDFAEAGLEEELRLLLL